MSERTVIGIDLGTTHSLCSVFKEGSPMLIPNSHGDFLTPSVVGVLKDDQIIVGQAAKELSVLHPERCATCFKRNMGTDQRTSIGPYLFSAPELSSIILTSLKEDAEKHLRYAVHDAVITVPAYFNDNQRKATKIAGEIAKLNVLRVINEPTAAALAYGFNESNADKKMLVFDLGGGTFDVTLMEIFEGTLEIIATAGECFLGGEDFTNKLLAHVLEKNGFQLETAEIQFPAMVARLAKECEQAKRELSTKESTFIRMPDEKGTFDDSKTVSLSNSEFVEIVDDYTSRLRIPLNKVLRDSNLTVMNIDEIILVGGATRMRLIHDYLFDFFQKEPLFNFDPDQVVALGASVQIALIEDDRSVDDIVMTDVCPHTLGVHVVKEFKGHFKDGYFMPVIHRNTTIPVSRENSVFTVYDNQREMLVEVYQGEARKIEGNLKLGELRVLNLPNARSGLQVDIRFSYDLNGILEIECIVPSINKKFNTVLTNSVKTLSDEEIREAVKKLQAIKFYPRDDTENQRLLLYAERVLPEVNYLFREELEIAIDQFEYALHANNRESFDATKELLLRTLSRSGFSYH